MQSEPKLTDTFLKNHYPVVVHNMNCILESRMMLDEDLQLLLTFWSPTSTTNKTNQIYSTLACTVSAVTGLIISSKFNKLYPLIASLAPTFVHLSYKTRVFYYDRKYKSNCEKLVSNLTALHDLNREVLEYNQRVMINWPKISDSGFSLLKSTRCDFLKCAITTLMKILENLIAKMREISNLVPITEGEYMYAGEWNLEHFVPNNLADFNELLHAFESLSDLSILIVSNFLGCIGLTFCIQLWKGKSINFNRIFDDVIPGVGEFLDVSIQSIKEQFGFIRFTLVDSTGEFKRQVQKKTYVQVHQPLCDFLFNTQLLFEATKHLRLVLGDELKNEKDLSLAFDEVNRQFAKCCDSHDSVELLVRRVSKHSHITNSSETLASVVQNAPTFLTPVEIHQEDDSLPLFEDEEYSLSIHGSDIDDEIAPIIDMAEQCSSENLELMLVELKRKLDERKIKRNIQSADVNADCAIEKDTSEVSTPPPPPPPIPCLPSIDNPHRAFLDAVRSVARNLNREEEFQFGFNMFPEIPRPFNTTYYCYSVAMLPGNERQDVERGGKIIMPPSALETLTRLNINYPMLFKIVNKKTNRTSHCGVLEFVADEGKVYLPLWLMHNLVLEEGDLIQIESVSLPVGKFAKFQPLSPEFLDITNPKAVLENCLRTFACLTTGDVIAVRYNQKAYELCVLETQPGNAISIIECDMNVEFAAPIGYKEADEFKPNEEEMAVDPADLMPEPSGFVAFKGTGNRLDGKRRKDSAPSEMPVQKPVYVRGIPDYDYQIGTLRFLRNLIKSPAVDKEENPEFKVFGGKGFSLNCGI